MKMPMWAQDLVIEVAIDEGRDDLPDVTWRHSKVNAWSSGTTYNAAPRRIVVTAGKVRKDQKIVLLHELAHWLLPVSEHHGTTFWDKVWELFRRYEVPIMYAKTREGNYRKGAIAAYRRSR